VGNVYSLSFIHFFFLLALSSNTIGLTNVSKQTITVPMLNRTKLPSNVTSTKLPNGYWRMDTVAPIQSVNPYSIPKCCEGNKFAMYVDIPPKKNALDKIRRKKEE